MPDNRIFLHYHIIVSSEKIKIPSSIVFSSEAVAISEWNKKIYLFKTKTGIETIISNNGKKAIFSDGSCIYWKLCRHKKCLERIQ
jgi:ribosomal protein S4